jgi:hypothetical protein
MPLNIRFCNELSPNPAANRFEPGGRLSARIYSYHNGRRTVGHVVGAEAVEWYTDRGGGKGRRSRGEVDLLEKVGLRVEYLQPYMSNFPFLSERLARHAHFG